MLGTVLPNAENLCIENKHFEDKNLLTYRLDCTDSVAEHNFLKLNKWWSIFGAFALYMIGKWSVRCQRMQADRVTRETQTGLVPWAHIMLPSSPLWWAHDRQGNATACRDAAATGTDWGCVRGKWLLGWVGYLTTLQVARPCSVEWWNNEWVMNWKGLGNKRPCNNLGTVQEGLRNTTKYVSQVSPCLSGDSNPALPEYESRLVPLW
jgi:hypothetical protein